MTDQPTEVATLVGDPGRAPTRFQAGRICTEPSCETRLSMYNRYTTCFLHSPIRFPRVRGRISREPSDEASE